MMQPRKPKGAPNGTGGQYTTQPTGPTMLPHLDQHTGNGCPSSHNMIHHQRVFLSHQ